jgi:hypothetical protein
MDDQRDAAGRRAEWDADPLTDHPVGPDDAGNAVMVGLGFVARAWRWLATKFSRTSTPH